MSVGRALRQSMRQDTPFDIAYRIALRDVLEIVRNERAHVVVTPSNIDEELRLRDQRERTLLKSRGFDKP